MGKYFFLAFFSLTLFADPPQSPKHLWRNANDYKHYFLYEKSTNTWVETINCAVYYRFTKVSSDYNNLVLYDAGRKLYVSLSYGDMKLRFAHEPAFKFYQAGSFDKRVRFFHQYGGQWSGTISRKNACAWEEQFPGVSGPSYFFRKYGEDAASIYLLDSSRNMRVKLNQGDMWLQASGQPSFSYFKNGYWSEY